MLILKVEKIEVILVDNHFWIKFVWYLQWFELDYTYWEDKLWYPQNFSYTVYFF